MSQVICYTKTNYALLGYISVDKYIMARAYKNSEAIKNTDGRKNNGRKKGETRVAKAPKMTPSQLNKAKKDRMTLYAINAIRQEYGSEEDFWLHMAKHARKSFSHAKTIMEYAYGKPNEDVGGAKKSQAPIIVFNNQQSKDIEIQEIEYED